METAAVLAAVFGGAVASSVLPLVNAELLIVGAGLAGPRGLSLALAVTVTAGQMLGKTALFLAGRGTGYLGKRRASERVQRLVGRLENRPRWVHGVFALSAFSGVPPFYLMTVAAGGLAMRLPAFLLLGTSGRFLRFLLLAHVPSLWGLS